MADRNFKDVMERDDAFHQAESILTAYALTARDKEYAGRLLDALQKIKQPSYKGPVNLPEDMTQYVMRRGDFWNLKQQLSVLALDRDNPNAPKAMEYIMEAFRVMHAGYQPLPVSAAAPKPNGGETVAEKEAVGENASQREAVVE